eukprot:TRINITY_DN61933_c0_g1_i1.p1 TRINITY_DN61933_c0_g1~~TRINITY_DN61933_c0_g1_i1.p1  ORF type:complete len:316 (+),score=61.84 TRINITY_DN61933_c0_g1_i1:77-949(+)
MMSAFAQRLFPGNATAKGGSPTSEARKRAATLEHKIAELDEALRDMDEEEDMAVAPAVQDPLPNNATRLPVTVVVGNLDMARSHHGLVEKITSMVSEAYGYRRVDEDDIYDRLAMGDPGPNRANRVLHIAFSIDKDGKPGEPVGCMSSTFSVPWAERGCGHWGLLVVDRNMQGKGIASALVAAAEERLARAVSEIQIEYEYTQNDAFSERLRVWYEEKCGFHCAAGAPRGRGTQFRKCRKKIPQEVQRRGQRLRLQEIRDGFAADLASFEATLGATCTQEEGSNMHIESL